MITQSKIVKINADASEYLTQDAERGTPEFVMSSSAMKEFDRCPSRWKAGYRSPESKSKEWGTLIDCLALQPDSVDERFALQPETYKDSKGVIKPWHNGSNSCKAWTAEQRSVGREIVTQEKLDAGRAAVSRLMSDDILADFINSSDRQVWVSFVWKDKTGIEVPVRCLLDLVPRKDTELFKCLADLKTVQNASRHAFGRQVFSLAWHLQAALYTDAYVAATGEDRCEWNFVIQENYAPYETGRRILSSAYLELGRNTYRRIMANYCRCLATGQWPSYDSHANAVQGWSITEPEDWMLVQSERFEVGETEDAVVEFESLAAEEPTDIAH